MPTELKQQDDLIKGDIEKRKKYDPNSIFKSSIKEVTLDKEAEEIKALVIVKENLFTKIINKIKLLFKKK